MPDPNQPTILLASGDPALLHALEPVLQATGARVSVILSAEAALAAMAAPDPPSLALLDVTLPGVPTGQLLAAVRAQEIGCPFTIVLLADSISEEWREWLRLGVIDDLVPPAPTRRFGASASSSLCRRSKKLARRMPSARISLYGRRSGYTREGGALFFPLPGAPSDTSPLALENPSRSMRRQPVRECGDGHGCG